MNCPHENVPMRYDFNREGPLSNILLFDESASVLALKTVELFAQVETHYKSLKAKLATNSRLLPKDSSYGQMITNISLVAIH